MKTKTHKGKLVTLLHKTSHGVSRVRDVLTDVVLHVPTVELESQGRAPYLGKTVLSNDDRSRLSAARGLVFGSPRAIDRSGHVPTVTLYNLAVKCGEYLGALITPVGA